MNAKYRVFFLLFFVSIYSLPINSQTKINYGSNKGKYISIDNTKIYYEEYGKGIPLLLLHGGLGSIADFQLVIDELSKHYHVIAADRPGHGRSEQADSLSYQLMADYTSKMIDIMKLDSVYVLGWSDGGTTALILTLDRKDKVKKVLVSGANISLSGLTQDAQNFLPYFTPEYVEKEMKEQLTEYQSKSPQKDKWKKFVNDIQKLWMTKTIIPEEKLKLITIPTTIVLGDHDGVALEHGIQMFRLINKSSFCVLPATTHYVFNERPELINKIALEFFKK